MHGDSKDVCVNPGLIVEVLSPSTAAYDRGLKFKLYRISVEHYTRQENDSWALREYSGETAIVRKRTANPPHPRA